MLKLKIPFCLTALLLLSSCFEVIEEVTYKNVEGGTYLVTVNCSQSKTKLGALMKLDTFMGLDIPTSYEVSRYFDQAVSAVKKFPGISNVRRTEDFENFIFTFSMDFDKTETLNKAINAAAVCVTRKSNLPYYNVFGMGNDTFQRNQTPNDSIAGIIKKNEDKLKLISGAKAISIYRFTKTVGKVSNPKATVAKNKKAVMLQQSVSDILLNPSLFSNTITF
jgi:hypothetical protein